MQVGTEIWFLYFTPKTDSLVTRNREVCSLLHLHVVDLDVRDGGLEDAGPVYQGLRPINYAFEKK